LIGYRAGSVTIRPESLPGVMSVRLAASSDPIKLFRLASPTSLRTAESRTLIVEGESDSMAARHSINKDRERGRLAQKAKRSIALA
jgi:hypothetical protein